MDFFSGYVLYSRYGFGQAKCSRFRHVAIPRLTPSRLLHSTAATVCAPSTVTRCWRSHAYSCTSMLGRRDVSRALKTPAQEQRKKKGERGGTKLKSLMQIISSKSNGFEQDFSHMFMTTRSNISKKKFTKRSSKSTKSKIT